MSSLFFLSPKLADRVHRLLYLAGGCFWGLQKFFDQFGEVIRTEAGYANTWTRTRADTAISQGLSFPWKTEGKERNRSCGSG